MSTPAAAPGWSDPDEAYSETSPLLPNPAQDASEAVAEGSQAPTNPSAASRLPQIAMVLLALFFFEGGRSLHLYGFMQVLRDAVCQQYSMGVQLDSFFPRDKCNDDLGRLQDFGRLLSWQGIFELLPAFIAAVPYGFFADKFGRRNILCLSIVGTILYRIFYMVICRWPNIFPVKLVWLAPVFTLIGGGSFVTFAMVYALLADMSDPAHRSFAYFYVGGAVTIVYAVVSESVNKLTSVNPWLPVHIGLALYIAALAIAYFIPETMSELVAEEAGPEQDGTDHRSGATGSIWSQFTDEIEELLLATSHIIWGNKKASLLIYSTVLISVAAPAQVMVFMYPFWDPRFEPLGIQTLMYIRMATGLCLLLVVLPAISIALTRASTSPMSKDLLLARVSYALLLIGYLILGFSFHATTLALGFVVFSLSAGSGYLIHSILSFMIEAHHFGLLFTSIGVLGGIAASIRGFLVTLVNSLTSVQGFWLRIPLFAASFLVFLALVLLWSVRRQ